MGVILNANYKIFKNNQAETVPAPVDKDTPNVPWWYDKIASNAAEYKAAGFKAVLLPAACKTQSGSYPTGDGYGKFDDYDIGSKNQNFSIPTRFGSDEQLRRCASALHAKGLNVYGDVVLHQYDGGSNGTYLYVGSDGKTKNGRFPKHPSCFVNNPPGVAIDPVWSTDGNYAFGDMCSYVNSTPKNYMADGAIDAGDWLKRTVGYDGFRIDDTKGSNLDFIKRYCNSKSLANAYVFGELFDGNPQTLQSWVNQMNGRCGTIDFTTHWHLQTVCDNNGYAGDLLNPNSGFFWLDNFHAVTYVESPDTDLSPGQQIMSNKGLAYWYILSVPGYPMVYYRDYASDPECYGLKPIIDNQIWVHENLANGDMIPRYGDDKIVCFERSGQGPGLVTAANWDTWNRRTITVNTNFGSNMQLHDYSGHHEDIWTNGYGQATFTVPTNAYSSGKSYVSFSKLWQNGTIYVAPIETTQDFEGAADMSVSAIGGETVVAGSIWVEAKSMMKFSMLETSPLLSFHVEDPLGFMLTINEDSSVESLRRGRHIIKMTSLNAVGVKTPFVIRVSYMGLGAIHETDFIK